MSEYLKQIKGIKADSKKQNNRIGLFELQNKNQDDGIQFLKMKNSDHLNHYICPEMWAYQF